MNSSTPPPESERAVEKPTSPKDEWKRISMAYIYRFVPVTRWAPTLTPRIAVGDCVSGFIVGVMIVPTCLSWSSLAGLPLSCGLIAALVASFTYGTFGQCASLSMGPVAEITTLLISIPGIAPEQRKDVFQSLGVQVGILSMILSFVDCGTVIKTIFAKAVGDGYTCAAALLAIAAQLKVMFNVTPTDRGYGNFINTLIAMTEQWSRYNLFCFFLFLVYCTYLIQIKKTRLPLWIPHQLIVVVVSILVTKGFRLDERWGMAIVKDIPASLSWPRFPPMNDLIELGPYTLTITVISFVQMYVVAQRVMPNIDPNTELFAGGVTNLLVNLMSGMPVSNSFSCSSVLIEQKVHTPLTAYSAGTVVLITILFLTRLGVFYYLPKQALAAIVTASVWRLVNFSGPAQLWHYSRKDAMVWVLTFVLTVVGGITIGVLSGIAFSLILVVLRIARPRAVSVGFNMQTFRYGDIRKDPELLVYPNILMWRFDAPLYFINTVYFQERLQAAIAAEVRPIDVVLVTCGKVVDIDAAALASLPIILDGVASMDPNRPRRIILTDIHGRLEKVLLASAALPIYVPEEYDRLSVEHITASGKFPIVFKKLEDAIGFAQRCISELYGNVDTAPYPNVSFLTDVVVKAARQSTKGGCAPSLLSLIQAELQQDGHLPSGAASPRQDPSRGSAGNGDSLHGPQIIVTGPEEHPTSPSRASVTAQREATVPSPAQQHTEAAAVRGNHNTNDGADRPRDEDSLVRHLATLKKLSTYSPDRELVGVLGVIRHSEVTPKQKKKLLFTDPVLLQLAFDGFDLRRTKRSIEELSEFFAVVERRLAEAGTYTTRQPGNNTSFSATSPEEPSFGNSFTPAALHFDSSRAENWARVMAIVRSAPEGLKIQVKARFPAGSGAGSFVGSGASGSTRGQSPTVHQGHALSWHSRNLGVRPLHGYSSASGPDEDEVQEPPAGLLVVKWGGVLTRSGITQAHVMGERLFARFYAAGDLPLRRLVQFTRRPRVTASDENRVVNTALVVANALTQSYGMTVHRGDVKLDDRLTKTLGPIAKRLLREEYKYFEALLHIESAAAARHFFHIPGFRQLLWIPPMDRPIAMGRSGGDEDDFEGAPGEGGHVLSETSSNNSEGDGLVGAHHRDMEGRSGDEQRPSFSSDARSFGFQGAPGISFMHANRGFSMSDPSQQSQQRPNYNVLRQNEFYTPYQALQELEGLMTTLATIKFPAALANVPLSNHETLKDLQQRYYAMLTNYLGEKRRIREGGARRPATDSARSHRQRTVLEGEGTMTSGKDDGYVETGTRARRSHNSTPEAVEERQMLLDAMEETGGSSDEDGVDDQFFEDGARLSEEAESGSQPASAPHRASYLITPGERTGRQQPQLQQQASARPRTSPAAGASKRSSRLMTETTNGPLFAPPGFTSDRGGANHGSANAPAGTRYDLSDVSKLRDYGSYDIGYNRPLLLQLHDLVEDGAMQFNIRRFTRALQRFADITEYMSRIGENVLEGVNSSKRFIIGSLVSNGLLKRLYGDFGELALTDEERGVHELLLRAQAQYMAENGGVEQDVRQMIRLFSKLPCMGEKPDDQVGASPAVAWSGETRQEREFRLRFPFIAIPKAEQSIRTASRDFNGCTRLYFTSYLHVEGVLQCLFESATVEGFSRPSKEEMEATHQLYMRHLIFKIFRRRNVSFTDAEVVVAFRRLKLLFHSDEEYETQQRDLRRGLAAIYHSMYYVSMEVYLSLGDADEGMAGEKEGFPLFTSNSNDASAAQVPPEDAEGSGSVEAASEVGSAAPSANGTVEGRGERTGRDGPPAATASTSASAAVAVGQFSLPVPSLDRSVVADSATAAGLSRSPLYVSRSHSPSLALTSDLAQQSLAPTFASPLAATTGATFLPVATGSGASDAEMETEVLTRTLRATNSTLAGPSDAGTQKTRNAGKRCHSAGQGNHAKEPVKEATVLVTPEAGRRTAAVQEMKHRVLNVTPMRRIHEGLSLNDFVLLMKEVESAVRSQAPSSFH